MAHNRALMVVTSHSSLGDTGDSTGYYLAELSHPYSILKENGFRVEVASPAGGKAPMDPRSRDLRDPVNKAFLEDAHVLSQLENTIKLGSIDPADYNVVVFAGGHGTMWDFPNNPDIDRIASNVYSRGGVVAAVCHGPAALVNVKLPNGKYLVEGKRVATFTNEEEIAVKLDNVVPFALESRLKERGAIVEKAPDFQEKVVSDGRLITGQNPASAAGVGKAIVSTLVGGRM